MLVKYILVLTPTVIERKPHNNVLIIEDIVKHHRKKQNSDDVSPHAYEYELNKSTGNVEKRFIEPVARSKPKH